MIMQKREYHNVVVMSNYIIQREDIEESDFNSEEELKHALEDQSHDRYDEAWDLMEYLGPDEEEQDWVSDRKGGYDIEWEAINDD